jgi:pimeloyl-ACP methyl ester carboxylesterase
MQSYHAMKVLAERLSTQGIHVLRLDYHGTGESLGSDADPGRVAAWLDSVRLGVQALRQLKCVRQVGLVGVRMGATLAVRAASNVAVEELVLWAPCPSGATYVRELEILASASLAALVERDSSRGSAGRAEPEGLTAGGYLLTWETVKDLRHVAIKDDPLPSAPDVLLIERDDQPPVEGLAEHFSSRGCRTTTERMAGFKEMMVAPAESRVPHWVFSRITDWVLDRSEMVGRPIDNQALLEHEVEEGTVRHLAVRFGPSRELFGVLTEPVPPSPPNRAPVLFLAGGAVPRTAVNRMYVTCARRLARAGHPALRIDVSGIGESPPRGGAPYNTPYGASLLEDVRYAIDFIEERYGAANGVCLVGLCSGAFAAFRLALDDPRIVSASLVNPLVFYWTDGMSLDSATVQQFLTAKGHRQSLLRLSRWRALFSGQVQIANLLRIVSARARTWMAARLSYFGSLMGRPSSGLAGDFDRLLERDVRTRIAFSEGDPGEYALKAQIGAQLHALVRKGVEVEVFPDADHTFSSFRVREALLEWIAAGVVVSGPRGRSETGPH